MLQLLSNVGESGQGAESDLEKTSPFEETPTAKADRSNNSKLNLFER